MTDSTHLLPRGVYGSILLPLVLLALIAFPGCKEDPTSSNGNLFTSPNVGSSYTFETYDLDSNGVRIPGSTDSSTMRVKSTGISFQERGGVTTLAWDNTAGDSLAFIYETNGDLTAWSEGEYPSFLTSDDLHSSSFWTTIRYSNKSSRVDTLLAFDTTATINDEEVRFTVTEVMEYTGEENLQIGSETISTLKTIERHYITETTPSETHAYNYAWTQWYAPKLGFIAKLHGMRIDEQSRTDQWGMALVSYDLK